MSPLFQGRSFQICAYCESTFPSHKAVCDVCGQQTTQRQSEPIVQVVQPPIVQRQSEPALESVQPPIVQRQSEPTVQAVPPPVVQRQSEPTVQAVQLPIVQTQPKLITQSVQSQNVTPPPLRTIKKDVEKVGKQRRTTLIYFVSIFLIIFFLIFAGLRSAGVSLSTLIALTSRTAITPTVGYTTPGVAPLFADNFSSDMSGWNLQRSPGDYTVTISNNALVMELNKNKLLWELLPGEISYGDFLLTVDATLAKGDQNNGYGVYIRGASNPDSDLATYYRFELYGDGSYAIFKGLLDPNGKSIATKIVNYTLSPSIRKQGKTNRMIIIAKGSSLSFIVNDKLLKTISDHSYASGSIALFASNLPEAKPGIQVQFSRFALYPVQVSKSA